MTVTHVSIDSDKPLAEEPETGHNRWHPEIDPVAFCDSGDEVLLETRDALDGQIRSASDISAAGEVDLNLVHPLTGPVFIEGAKPGDLLEVEVLEVTTDDFGYTIQPPGFALLRDWFPDPFLVTWDIRNGVATSSQLPGVSIPGNPFMGVIGLAPDRDLMNKARRREEDAFERGEMVFPSVEPTGSVPGGRLGAEGLRTGPPRENGGNLDIKQCAKGARLYFPVLVEGALLSVGDAHFAQGDGEVCGQAIETRARLRAKLTVHSDAASRPAGGQFHFTYQQPPQAGGPYMVTTGIAVSADGVNQSENVFVAAQRAVLEMIEYLCGRGFTRQQAYSLCSVAADLRISQLVNVPNVGVTASLPLDIFD